MRISLPTKVDIEFSTYSESWSMKNDKAILNRPLICIHGGPGGDGMEGSAAVSLNRFSYDHNYEVLAYDQRGCGNSSWGSPFNWNLANWADDLEALIKILHLYKPLVFGLSHGAMVLQEFLIERSHLLSGAVLLSSGARWKPDPVVKEFSRLGGKPAQQAAEKLFNNRCPDLQLVYDYDRYCSPLYTGIPSKKLKVDCQEEECQIKYNIELSSTYWGSSGEGQSLDQRNLLKNVSCPTWVIGNKLDPMFSPKRSKELRDALTPEMFTMLNGGHADLATDQEKFRKQLELFHSSYPT